ncbi:MAG TPA: HAMP domain-containing sensor histidine kinase [Rheinheimera sp.]|nr:HAMP domain-containing sensor histidine kinase [Rheinheimera sp.]
MQQLFWRFFLVFWATLLMAIVLVRLTFVWQDDGQIRRPLFPAGQHADFAAPADNLPPRYRAVHPAPPFWRHPLLHLTLLFGASLVFSWLLARYIAAPVQQLKLALAGLAANKWQTQLGPPLTTRRDEFGSLSTHFNQMAAQAAEAIASQRRLLHDVSHELRSPLARIQILTGLASQSPADAALVLDKIEQEVTKLDALVAEILTFSRLEDGSVKPENIAINLAELVASICEDARLEASNSQKSLCLQLDPVANIQGDPSLLYSAIENVIRNAVKYTPAYSEVSVNLQQQGQLLTLQVCDQGPGVPSQHLARLFTPFFRAHSNHSGIGLGLSIAKRAVEACGGRIVASNMVQNNKISGFKVVITLPADSSAVQPV